MTTTRSKLSVPPYSPSLAISHVRNHHDQTFYTLSDGCYHSRSIPEMRNMFSFASSHGWCLMLHYSDPKYCYLFNPVSFEKIELPPLFEPFSGDIFGAITSSPIDDPHNCVVTVISADSNSFIFCRPKDANVGWIQQEYDPTRNLFKTLEDFRCVITNCDGTLDRDLELMQQEFDPSGNNTFKFLDGISGIINCKGKLYIFYRHGLIRIDFDIVNPRQAYVTRIDIDYPEYSVPDVSNTTHFIVESCGDIYLVIKLFLGMSKVIQTFDVFKLDFSSMVWVKVETIGDRIFLLDCNSVSATPLGVKGGDCFHFLEDEDTSLYTFHMADGSIMTTQTFSDVIGEFDSPYWILPKITGGDDSEFLHGKSLVKQQMTLVEEHKLQRENEMGCLKDLPEEIILSISSLLLQNLGDYTYFRLSCKTLKSIIPLVPPQPPILSTSFLMSPEFDTRQPPWLMSISKNSLKCKIHHPTYNYSYSKDLPELTNATIRHYKHGWLLMEYKNKSFFFFNPVSRETIKLPDIPLPAYRDSPCVGITFSFPPTSKDCIVLGYMEYSRTSYVEMIVYSFADSQWKTHFSLNDVPFSPSYCNPVYCNGSFYCLSQNGEIGILNEADEEYEWNILPNLEVKNMYTRRCFLVENDGHILSVFIGRMSESISVLKLDRSDEVRPKWVTLESIGDNTIFLSRTTSIMQPARCKSMKNKIYLPMSHEKRIVFYSLSTRKYYSIGSGSEDLITTSVDLNSTWIDYDVAIQI